MGELGLGEQAMVAPCGKLWDRHKHRVQWALGRELLTQPGGRSDFWEEELGKADWVLKDLVR